MILRWPEKISGRNKLKGLDTLIKKIVWKD